MKRLFWVAIPTMAGCMSIPAPPPPPYHGVGTEPFWNLLIDEHNMTFVVPGGPQVTQPTPKVIIGIAGEIYQTPRNNVNIVHGQCSDGLSERHEPDEGPGIADCEP